MIFVDINTFFGPKAGGIRTYHQAKLDWFARQDEHVYCLVYPGAAYRVERPSPRIVLVQVRGVALTADPQGYRLIVDYFRAWLWIRKLKPQVIEAGDSWLTSLFCLFLKRTRLRRGLFVSFYHSDPIPTYVLPWAERGSLRPLRRALAAVAARMFYAAQRRYDCTAVASVAMEEALRARGVTRLRRLAFGVPPVFFSATGQEPLRRLGAAEAPVRLLYAGRLDGDKGVGMLLEILPVLLEDPSFRITVAGRGAYADPFADLRHERYRYAGFVSGVEAMASLYATHDVFLAPGPHETFGLGVLEAMAAGLVVVGPDAGGSAELLREADSPFVFSAGDASAFLGRIRAAASADLPVVSRRNRETARTYGTWDDAIGRMVAAWKGMA